MFVVFSSLFFLLFYDFVRDSKRFLINDTNYCLFYIISIILNGFVQKIKIFHSSLPFPFPILSNSWGSNSQNINIIFYNCLLCMTFFFILVAFTNGCLFTFWNKKNIFLIVQVMISQKRFGYGIWNYPDTLFYERRRFWPEKRIIKTGGRIGTEEKIRNFDDLEKRVLNNKTGCWNWS